MRGARWLLILAILVVLGGTGITYLLQTKAVSSGSLRKPNVLPEGVTATAEGYSWERSSPDKPPVNIRATGFRQVTNSPVIELEGVELRIYQKDKEHFDLVKSAKAEFNQKEGKMFSEGDVEITLSVPVKDAPAHALTSIRTSGVTFESKSGKAVTDKPTAFTFEHGNGKSVGASYDPHSRELHLNQQVELHMLGNGAKAKPMTVQAGELTYKETGSVIWLTPWAKLTRDQSVIDAAATVINLKDGAIQAIDALKAHGTDKYPKRQVDYSADKLQVTYGDDGEVRKVAGTGTARLVAATAESATTMTGDRVDLDFSDQDGEATLTTAQANGNGMVEAEPIQAAETKPPPTRILRSAAIEMHMRPGGKEIQQVQTHSPGTLEFLPNQPRQRHRVMEGERMTIDYGPKNQISNFQSSHVTTTTFPLPSQLKPKGSPPGPSRTTSDRLNADFDLNTGQLQHMKQDGNFVYVEGDRNARSETATLDSEKNLMDLDHAARFWDQSGSTDADHIQLLQASGDVTATGHVNTSRLPDKKPGAKQSAELLDGDEPIQGTSAKMTSANKNRLVHYEGNAVLWQGANRVQADVIDLDREKHKLTANNNVTTQFLDKTRGGNSEDDKPKASVPPSVFTIVRAAKMIYTDEDRVAHYTGAVTLTRPDLTVSSSELRATLAPKDAITDSRIEKAVADGKVQIDQITPVRSRKGISEHAEYYTADQRIFLSGGDPQLLDSKRGNTRGRELTYFADDDRLLVSGDAGKPVTSRLHRK